MRRIIGHLRRAGATAVAGALAIGSAASASPLQAAQTVAAGDPAADRLEYVTYGFAGLGALILVATIWYWFATRPPRVEESASDPIPAEATAPVVAAAPAVAAAAMPAPAVEAAGPVPAVEAPAVMHAPVEPEAIDLTAGETDLRSSETEAAVVLSPLAAALASIPDMEPTVVRFDDPPVERVRRPLPPPGAPNFDRVARENTARHQAVESARRAEQRPARGRRTIDPDVAREASMTHRAVDAQDAQAAQAAPAPAAKASAAPKTDPAPVAPQAEPAPEPQRRVLQSRALPTSVPASPKTPRRPLTDQPDTSRPRRQFDPSQRRVAPQRQPQAAPEVQLPEVTLPEEPPRPTVRRYRGDDA